MTTWKYTDSSNRVVARTFDDGSCQSCLAEVLPTDTEILPADLPSANELILQQIAALEEANPITARRKREEALGATWIADLEAQIAALRVGLK